MFVLMFNNYVHGDYPYMPHSKWANISETGPQSVSGTGDFRSVYYAKPVYPCPL